MAVEYRPDSLAVATTGASTYTINRTAFHEDGDILVFAAGARVTSDPLMTGPAGTVTYKQYSGNTFWGYLFLIEVQPGVTSWTITTNSTASYCGLIGAFSGHDGVLGAASEGWNNGGSSTTRLLLGNALARPAGSLQMSLAGSHYNSGYAPGPNVVEMWEGKTGTKGNFGSGSGNYIIVGAGDQYTTTDSSTNFGSITVRLDPGATGPVIHEFVPADALHGHTADSTSLTEALAPADHEFAPDDATHAHTADTTSLEEVAPQKVGPTSTGLVGGTWTMVPTGDPLTAGHTVVDEDVPDDTDYLLTPNNPDATVFFTFGLGALNTPSTNSPVIMRIRADKDAGARTIDLVAELRQGPDTIITSLAMGTLNSNAPTTYEDVLLADEVAAITNWDDLRIRVNPSTAGGGSGSSARIYWVEFEAPAGEPSVVYEITPADALHGHTADATSLTIDSAAAPSKPTVVGSPSAKATAAVTSHIVPLPAGIDTSAASKDVLVMYHTCTSSSATTTTPTDWTRLGTDWGPSDFTGATFVRSAVGATAPTVTMSASADLHSVIVAYRGAEVPTAAVQRDTATGQVQSYGPGLITTSGANQKIVYCAALDASSTGRTATSDNADTELYDAQLPTTLLMGIYEVDAATAGTYDRTMTITGTTQEMGASGVALVPVASSSTTTNLVPADATHAHTADSASLTQTHALTPADASHDHSADQSALTQDHSLAPVDAVHGHTADSTSVSAEQYLQPASTTHAHTAEATALTQEHSLAPRSGVHTHTADASALSQVHDLVPGDAAHAHTADPTSLDSIQYLEPSDALHGHTAEGTTLSQVHSLKPAEVVHTSGADSTSLTQVHSLAPNDATHAHTADSTEMTAEGTFEPNDAFHGHTADPAALTQVHALAPRSSAHSHSADATSVSQDHSLAPQDAVHEHTADSTALDSLSRLTPSDVFHAHTAEGTTLGQVHSLAPDSSTHASTADPSALTQAHYVVPDDAFHEHTADAALVALTAFLAPDDAFHASTADPSALTQSHALAPDDATHAHVAAATALAQIHGLVPLDAFHGHTADETEAFEGSLRLPPERSARVDAEARVVAVPGEVRIVGMAGEVRVERDVAEERSLAVAAESRTVAVG